MKIKTLLLCVLSALLLTGCQLALPEKESDKGNRLVGVFITTEYLDLFDAESYLNDNLASFNGGEIKLDGDAEKYEGRLYADFSGKDYQEVRFGEVEGIPFFAAEILNDNSEPSNVTYSGDGLVESNIGVFYNDEEDKITLDGKVYIVPGINGQQHYFNPVYQSLDGKVFVQSGNGMSVSGVQSQGSAMSHKLEETITVTENGKSKKKTAVINISVETMLPPQKIMLVQMDKNNNILKSDEYLPGKLPETIDTDANAAYIIAEAHKTDFDGKALTERELYTNEDTGLTTFYENGTGVMASQYTQLIWQG